MSDVKGKVVATTGASIGIGEAAFHLASLVAHRFAVVTTLSRSIPAIETNLVKYGLASRCAKVRACEVPVLALDDPASGARAKLSAEIERAMAEEGAEAIVLGCAGMAELAASLAREHGLPVICHHHKRSRVRAVVVNVDRIDRHCHQVRGLAARGSQRREQPAERPLELGCQAVGIRRGLAGQEHDPAPGDGYRVREAGRAAELRRVDPFHAHRILFS